MIAIPAALDHLVAACTVALPNAQVIDGPPTINLEKVGVCIGYTPDVLSVMAISEGAGLDSNVENFDINCNAWVSSGEETVKAVRDQVFATVASIEQVLAFDPRLGGAVTNARLRVVDLDQAQLQSGTWAAVAFVITCKAFK